MNAKKFTKEFSCIVLAGGRKRIWKGKTS